MYDAHNQRAREFYGRKITLQNSFVHELNEPQGGGNAVI